MQHRARGARAAGRGVLHGRRGGQGAQGAGDWAGYAQLLGSVGGVRQAALLGRAKLPCLGAREGKAPKAQEIGQGIPVSWGLEGFYAKLPCMGAVEGKGVQGALCRAGCRLECL